MFRFVGLCFGNAGSPLSRAAKSPSRDLALRQQLVALKRRYPRPSHGPVSGELIQWRNPLRCQAITVSGLTRSSAERQSLHKRESKTHRLGQKGGDGAYDHGSNAAGPRADDGVQESLLAERRELGNNLAERKVESAWPGEGYRLWFCKCNDFNVLGVFGTDRLAARQFHFLECR